MLSGVPVMHGGLELRRRAPAPCAAVRVHQHADARGVAQRAVRHGGWPRVAVVLHQLFDQVAADLAARIYLVGQLGVAYRHPPVHGLRDLPHLEPGPHDDVGGVHVVGQVVLAAALRPLPAANPDHGDVARFDRRLQQQRGRHVGERAVEGDVQGPRIVPQSLFDDQARARRLDRGALVGQGTFAAVGNVDPAAEVHEIEQQHGLVVAVAQTVG